VKPSSLPSTERRGGSPSPIRVRLEFTIRDPRDTVPGVAKDVSLAGVVIETERPAPFGASVLVRLELPGYGDMILAGVVRWTTRDGMGIRFAPFGVRETRAIIEFRATR
jgi:hypothetical protein